MQVPSFSTTVLPPRSGNGDRTVSSSRRWRRLRVALATACGLVALATAELAHAESAAEDGAGDAEVEAASTPLAGVGLLSAHGFWAQGKVMPGLAFGLRLGFVQLDFEGAMLWLSESAGPSGISNLGSELGGHVMFLPVRERYVDLGVGLGADVFWLWNVHGDAVESALALKAAAHVWVTPELGLYGTARVYPLTTSGLELGTSRDRDDGLPVLFSTGITWRL